MPIYDYGCDCGETATDVIVPYAEVDIHREFCVACGGEMRRLFNAPPRAIYRASGFYATDYGPSR